MVLARARRRSRTELRQVLLRILAETVPGLREEVQACASGYVADNDRHRDGDRRAVVRHAAADVAERYHLKSPWIVSTFYMSAIAGTRHRSMRDRWLVISDRNWGHPLAPSRRVRQHRGALPSPRSKIQEPVAFRWYAQYQVLERSWHDTATTSSASSGAVVRMAVTDLARSLALPLRRGARGRPRKLRR